MQIALADRASTARRSPRESSRAGRRTPVASESRTINCRSAQALQGPRPATAAGPPGYTPAIRSTAEPVTDDAGGFEREIFGRRKCVEPAWQSSPARSPAPLRCPLRRAGARRRHRAASALSGKQQRIFAGEQRVADRRRRNLVHQFLAAGAPSTLRPATRSPPGAGRAASSQRIVRASSAARLLHVNEGRDVRTRSGLRIVLRDTHDETPRGGIHPVAILEHEDETAGRPCAASLAEHA